MRNPNVIAGRVRPRSLPAQFSAALLRPVYFFRTLTPLGETRQWLWVGLLICLLVGYSAVRYQELAPSAAPIDPNVPPIDFGGGIPGEIPGDFGGGGVIDGGGGIPGDFSGLPPGGVPGAGGDGGSAAANTTDSVTTGILAASSVVFGWGIITVLLSLVSLFSGRAPRLGHNFQIAVWASLPLALMTVIQLLYWLSGGTVRQAGVSGFLLQAEDLAGLPAVLRSMVVTWRGMRETQPFLQAVLLLFASNLTIFWLWGLMMLYFGARFALNGRRWSAVLAVVMWTTISLVLPVATGNVKVPEFAPPLVNMPIDMGGNMSGGDMSGGDFSGSGDFSTGDFSGEIPSDVIIVTEEASIIGADNPNDQSSAFEPIATDSVEVQPDDSATPEVEVTSEGGN